MLTCAASADMELFNVTGANENIADEAGALSRVTQLTGFSDPLYAECYVNVHRYDIVLDVLVMNRTKDTLQNVGLELATLGDLRLCDRSQFQVRPTPPLLSSPPSSCPSLSLLSRLTFLSVSAPLHTLSLFISLSLSRSFSLCL